VEQVVGRDADQLLGLVAEQVASGLRGVEEGAVAGVTRDQVGGAFRQPAIVMLLLAELGDSRF
jgi:hypothetical protein